MSNQLPNHLTIAILFSAAIITGSLIFLGLQIKDTSLATAQDAQAQPSEAPDKTPKSAKTPEALEAQNVRKVSKTQDHIRGNPDAPISIIEFSDFECPYCKLFHPTAKQIVENYDGQVNWVYRHFPLSFHNPLATKEAQATECANELGGNEKFWELADLIFETTKSNGRGMTEEDLIQLATDIGINQTEFKTCLESEKFTTHIQQDLADGQSSGISGTPGNIVLNNKTGEAIPVVGAQPLSAFQPVIDNMLK